MQIFMRHLGAKEDVLSRHARGTHAFADDAFGAVFPRRVDVAVARFQRGGDMLGPNITHAGRADADGGDLGAVRWKFWSKRHQAFLSSAFFSPAVGLRKNT